MLRLTYNTKFNILSAAVVMAPTPFQANGISIRLYTFTSGWYIVYIERSRVTTFKYIVFLSLKVDLV